MRTTILTLVATFFLYATAIAQGRIEVPYFGSMTSSQLCGRKDCRPTNARYWAPVSGGKLYDGTPGDILGRSFDKGIFETNPCVSRIPLDSDVNILASHNLSGKVQEDKKNGFDATVNANLVSLINQKNLPNSIKADLIAQIKNSVESATSRNIELVYRVVELKQRYIDEQVDACYARLERKRKIVTGISLITVKGDWTSNTLRDAFRKFETNAALFNSLSADAKASYEKSKQTLLSGNFEPFSLIISTAYKYKS